MCHFYMMSYHSTVPIIIIIEVTINIMYKYSRADKNANYCALINIYS